VLETAEAGEEGISSSALQLMFTLGTAFGAGAGGAIVALADVGVIDLTTAIGIVFGLMFVAAVLGIGVATRVAGGAQTAVDVEPTEQLEAGRWVA
jgi:hypothetical protein